MGCLGFRDFVHGLFRPGASRSWSGDGFVADIFQEVDEEVRREQFKKLWQRYGNLIVAVCALIVVGVGAWRGYEYWQAKKSAESGAAFADVRHRSTFHE